MFFFIPASSIVGFLIVHFGRHYISFESVFLISGVLTFVNLILLYFFDDKEMKSKKTIEYEKNNGLVSLNQIQLDDNGDERDEKYTGI